MLDLEINSLVDEGDLITYCEPVLQPLDEKIKSEYSKLIDLIEDPIMIPAHPSITTNKQRTNQDGGQQQECYLNVYRMLFISKRLERALHAIGTRD